jgi:hypothetical protein
MLASASALRASRQMISPVASSSRAVQRSFTSTIPAREHFLDANSEVCPGLGLYTLDVLGYTVVWSGVERVSGHMGVDTDRMWYPLQC